MEVVKMFPFTSIHPLTLAFSNLFHKAALSFVRGQRGAEEGMKSEAWGFVAPAEAGEMVRTCVLLECDASLSYPNLFSVQFSYENANPPPPHHQRQSRGLTAGGSQQSRKVEK